MDEYISIKKGILEKKKASCEDIISHVYMGRLTFGQKGT